MFLGMSSLCSSSFGGTGAPVEVVVARAAAGLGFSFGAVAGGEGMVALEGFTSAGPGTGVFGPDPNRQKSNPNSSKRRRTTRTVRSLRFMSKDKDSISHYPWV